MFGDDHLDPEVFPASNPILLAIVCAIATLIVGLAFMWAHEHRLKTIDRENQERITWNCNGNGGQLCRPIAHI